MTRPVMTRPSDVAFTPSVKAQQERRGSRSGYERMEQKGGWQDRVTAELTAFLAERDSFYLATATAEGQPYIHHRGGPKGFLKVLDDRTLAFADFGGNKQYITLGNLAENDRAHIFLMDYAGRQRVKLWGRAEVVEGDDALLTELSDPAYRGRPERVIRFAITAWDVNCPQHITPRFDEEVLGQVVEKLRERIAELEAENAYLRQPLG